MSAKPPVVGIISPSAGAHFKIGEQIKLQGYAADLEEGMVPSSNLSWSSNLDGALGTGDAREVTLPAVARRAVGRGQPVETSDAGLGKLLSSQVQGFALSDNPGAE